jgi:hypothetical protein
MRGSPLLRVLLIVVALLAMLWPLRSLTSHRAETRPPAATASEANVHLVLTSTSFPFSFEVSHLGKTIWKSESTESSISRDVKLEFPPEGVDLLLDVKCQGDKQAAVKLDVTVDNGDTMTKTIWGTGSVSGVLTFAKP